MKYDIEKPFSIVNKNENNNNNRHVQAILKASKEKAMYKTRNTGTGNGMRGTRGMGEMLYSGECRQTFRGMSPNIPGNVTKHSGECCQTFREMSPNIPGNVVKQMNFFFEADTFTKHHIFPEVYSEPLQISKMECFCVIS